jgi:hypothetical protein
VGFRPDARVQRSSLSMVKVTSRTFHFHTEKWRSHPGKAASQIKVLKTSEYRHGCALTIAIPQDRIVPELRKAINESVESYLSTRHSTSVTIA